VSLSAAATQQKANFIFWEAGGFFKRCDGVAIQKAE
jgi:hypothetical protein